MDRVQDPALAGMLKVCAIDEAWWVVRQPVLRGFTREQLKTSRRHNGVMLLATQTSDDFAGADLLRTVVESCPTRLLLANPAFDQDRYAELFQLSASERQLLSELMPRGQILLKRPDHTKVLNLRTDQKSYWLYTNTPLDNERANAVLREYGFAEGLDRLAAAAA
jgi:type IV secretory pathway VirB4 component